MGFCTYMTLLVLVMSSFYVTIIMKISDKQKRLYLLNRAEINNKIIANKEERGTKEMEKQRKVGNRQYLQRGITLIALIITVIVMLILAGVTINLTLNSGILNRSEEAKEQYEKSQAKEKLNIVLLELMTDKITNEKYNENEYVDEKFKKNNMIVDGDIVVVDGWEFEIDRSNLVIKTELGKETEFEKITRRKAEFICDVTENYVKSVNVSIKVDDSIKMNTIQYNLFESDINSTNWNDYTEGMTSASSKYYGTVTFGLVKEQSSNDFVVSASAPYKWKSYPSKLQIDTSELKGEYYIKILIKGNFAEGGYSCGCITKTASVIGK